MFLDINGLVVMEQSTFPGSIGDSCAESSRMVTLQILVSDKVTSKLELFITPQGVIRYPTSPWKENDTSSDQVSPLIAATALTDINLTKTIINNLDENHLRTGNGDIATPGLLANLERAENHHFLWFMDLCNLAQALIFKLPLTWNPNATMNPNSWLVSSSTQTSNYLNWINNLAFAKIKGDTWPNKLAKTLIKKEDCLAAVKKYYAPEPNSSWLLDLYSKALNKIWSK